MLNFAKIKMSKRIVKYIIDINKSEVVERVIKNL